MSLEALIFDVDGTLADTERDGHRVAFNRAFADAGLDWRWTEEHYGDLLAISGGKERMEFYLRDHPINNLQATDIKELIADLHQRKNAYYAAMLAQGEIALRPGVARLLKSAREQNVRLAIATTTSRPNIEGLIRHTLGTAALDWFDVIATADEVPDKKPSPAVFHEVLEQMSLGAGQCIAFEDSLNGLKATQAAGLPTVVTVNDYTRHEDFSSALLVVDQLGDEQHAMTVLGGTAADCAGDARIIDVALLRKLLP